jgi:ATP-dependent Clp protease protease subunit
MTSNQSSKLRMLGRKKEPLDTISFSVQDKIETEFLKQNIHFLFGEIDEYNITRAIQWIMYENNLEEKNKTLQLFINSPGGDLYQAFALIDAMSWSKVPIRTIGLGTVMSAAFLIFASGEKGERFISKNCGIMCHQYTDFFEGKYHDLESYRKETELCIQRMTNVLQSATNLDAKGVKTKLLTPSDVWLTAEELTKLGAADHII